MCESHGGLLCGDVLCRGYRHIHPPLSRPDIDHSRPATLICRANGPAPLTPHISHNLLQVNTVVKNYFHIKCDSHD